MFVVDEHQRIVGWNKPASAAFGRLEQSPLGAVCYDLVRATDRSGRPFCVNDCPVMMAAREGRAIPPLKLRLGGPDGSGHLLEVSTIVLSDEGKITGIVHLVRPEGQADAPPESLPSISSLTRRERQILGCLCSGQSTSTMARRLEISRTTVRNHIQHVLEKLAVHSRAEAIAAAHRTGALT